ncbi:pantoate--beta-alanine ligase [Methylophilus sp. YYY-1]|jgi:pantoate--beta-alanine ligase|uniref:pantoate--beta-alanine ligase n=1 Tax=Methylophilus sp. YYY-1 TaxID=2682087 RepID=UPI0023B260E7|nr:pantoate--beta-alanine ligase [Methylophilus sp. YYY-1]MDF0377393.1 pantoate--beta-alanine ligase [Methylophilus sp. YYY-1]
MQVCHSVRELRAFLARHPQSKVGFVPTMGNLHAGHCQLVTQAKQLAEIVVVSIFVNPLQFGVNEDFGSYPRTLAADCEQLEAVGADVVFAPTVTEMYPDFDGQDLRQAVVIQPPALANELCGASRPGHFVGVATVVAKLFNMVQPQVAVFGKKDYQQLMVIRTLVRQLNFNVEIVAGETVREPSGLAMSSRNGYLSATEKTQAAQLYQQLQRIKQALLAGQRDYASLCEQAVAGLNQQGWQVDYVDIRRQTDLTLPDANDQAWVILAAAKLGGTRLIDNCEVSL